MSRRNRYSVVKSFRFAFMGIIRSLRNERSLRIHLFAAAYVLYFSRYFSLSRAETAVLILAAGGVIALELINTAVESCVDLNTLAYSDLAKTAKDAAAGGVLVSALTSAAIGVLFFFRPAVLRVIWADVAESPFVWLFLFLITAFLIAWPEYRGEAPRVKKPAPKSGKDGTE